ncbi:MAG: hypothetical protein ACI9CF_001350 [Candidatus Omnitrophota bacterium]|jgi:uncharacterized protein (TIGR03546 family)
MIKPVFKLIQALQGNVNPKEIAAGAAYSLYLGLVPWESTHIIILFLLLFVFKINRAAALVLLPLIKLFDALGLYILADQLGYWLLTQEALKGMWACLTNAPILALMNLNHTRVLGGLVLATLLAPVLFWLAIKGVHAYRNGLKERMGKWKVVQVFMSMRFVKLIAGWFVK